MKKQIIRAAFAVIAIIVLSELGVFNALAMFILVGAVPGTDYSVPPSFMLLAMLGLMWFILYRFAVFKTLHHHMTSKLAKRGDHTHKKRMPRRRFSEI